MMGARVVLGDSLREMEKLESSSVDMVYLDPPFFTNRNHSATTRDRSKTYSFSDAWNGLSEYSDFMEARLTEIHRVLKDTGSIFAHCDTNANFLLRALLDKICGRSQFRSEIIWTYKRWSNSSKGLMPAHQSILFYSKSDRFKFNQVYLPYSETTNLDQILQLRARDEHGVSRYATDETGAIVYGGNKKGVPMSDVWEIPFLNPKAKERTGYPTQKPVLLLERIIDISTDTGDLILDPFCGSGTTLVAATLMSRNCIGIDNSPDAVSLAKQRLEAPTKSESLLLMKGRAAYANADSDALALLTGLDILPVQRNAGIDAFLKTPSGRALVPIRVQRKGESLHEAAFKLVRAAQSKQISRAILVRTQASLELNDVLSLSPMITLVDSTALQIMQKASAEL